MIFPLLKAWFTPVLGTVLSTMRSSQKFHDETPKDVVTFGGGGGGSSGPNWRRRGPPTANPLTTLAHNESEEHMVDSHKMQDMKSWIDDDSDKAVNTRKNNTIYKQVEVAVVSQDAHHSTDNHQRVPSNENQPWAQPGYSAFVAGAR